jgi:hypothetical protein
MAREVTVKSLSIAMGIRTPGFQMLTLSSGSTPKDKACFLPDQLGIYLEVYVPLILLSIVVLGVSHTVMRGAHGESSGLGGKRSRSRFEDDQKLPTPVSSSATAYGRGSRSGMRSQHPREIARAILRDFVDAAAAPVLFFLFISWWYLSEN